MQYIPSVHILLATYNGAKFLGQQLQSIAQQTHIKWTLTVSDDGSTDQTASIVQGFAQSVQQPVKFLQGPQEGASTKNFFHLIQKAPAENLHDLYAFCDQDDVWLPKKLEKALDWHIQNPDQAANLYCGRTQFVNEKLQPIQLSPMVSRTPCFENALVQNIASGNTMVMSHALLLALKKVDPAHSVWHDWTSYLLATALGGKVHFDEKPYLLYRQHSTNVIGSNDGFKAQIRRIKPLLNGRFKHWTDMNISAVRDLGELPTPIALELVRDFEQMRKEPRILKRLIAWRETGIHRQTAASNLSLMTSIVFGLI